MKRSHSKKTWARGNRTHKANSAVARYNSRGGIRL